MGLSFDWITGRIKKWMRKTNRESDVNVFAFKALQIVFTLCYQAHSYKRLLFAVLGILLWKQSCATSRLNYISFPRQKSINRSAFTVALFVFPLYWVYYLKKCICSKPRWFFMQQSDHKLPTCMGIRPALAQMTDDWLRKWQKAIGGNAVGL